MELKVHSSPLPFSLALFSSSLSTRLLVYEKQRTRRRTVFVVPFLPSPATTEEIFLVGEVKKKGKTFFFLFFFFFFFFSFFRLLLFFFFLSQQLQKGNQVLVTDSLVTDSFSHFPSLSLFLRRCIPPLDEKAPLFCRRVELGWRSSRCPGERRVSKGVGAGEKLGSFVAAKHGFEATDQSVARKFCLAFRVSRWCWWGLSQLEGSVLRPRKKEKKERRENEDA